MLSDEESINLTRRTVLGPASPEVAEGILGAFDGSEELSLKVADPIVQGPALQVLPMSISFDVVLYVR